MEAPSSSAASCVPEAYAALYERRVARPARLAARATEALERCERALRAAEEASKLVSIEDIVHKLREERVRELKERIAEERKALEASDNNNDESK